MNRHNTPANIAIKVYGVPQVLHQLVRARGGLAESSDSACSLV